MRPRHLVEDVRVDALGAQQARLVFQLQAQLLFGFEFGFQ